MRVIEALNQGPVPMALQDLVTTFVSAEPADATRAFLVAKAGLTAAIAQAQQAVEQAQRAERQEALAMDPMYLGLALATEWHPNAKERGVAESFIDQWERKGYLSERQLAWAEKIVAAARKAFAKQALARPEYFAAVHDAIVGADLRDGHYAVDYTGAVAHQDTTFVHILTDDDGTRLLRHIVGGKPERTPSREWCEQIIGAIHVDPVAALRRYGIEIGRCCLCHRHLTDLPSRQAGVGPWCAKYL
jgi:hypothetical protein